MLHIYLMMYTYVYKFGTRVLYSQGHSCNIYIILEGEFII